LKKIFLALLVMAAALAYWLYTRATAPPEMAFTRATRQRLESVLTTNGKVEPMEWAAARAEREGLVVSVPVSKGQRVAAGAPLALLDASALASELRAAQARADQARAEIQLLEAGGRGVDLNEIESGLRRARVDQASAQREIAALERLVEKNAAPRQELVDMRERLQRAEVQIRSLEDRRRAVVDRSSLDAARARLRETEAAIEQIQQRQAKSVVRAPLAGVIYALDARVGAWLAPGTQVAQLGRTDRVKVLVYVDEPELGRVAVGMPVRITWDALAGRDWRGTVDKKPAEIIALNTRQVGEVICVIDNPEGELLPGTNINAFIESKVVPSALTIPKETLRREGGELGVFTLTASHQLEWRKLTLGSSSVTRSEVLGGLKEGDAVLLPVDATVAPGLLVQPVYR